MKISDTNKRLLTLAGELGFIGSSRAARSMEKLGWFSKRSNVYLLTPKGLEILNMINQQEESK